MNNSFSVQNFNVLRSLDLFRLFHNNGIKEKFAFCIKLQILLSPGKPKPEFEKLNPSANVNEEEERYWKSITNNMGECIRTIFPLSNV